MPKKKMHVIATADDSPSPHPIEKAAEMRPSRPGGQESGEKGGCQG